MCPLSGGRTKPFKNATQKHPKSELTWKTRDANSAEIVGAMPCIALFERMQCAATQQAHQCADTQQARATRPHAL